MNFSSINIQGNIISSEILDKIRLEEKYRFQQPEAFGLSRNASLRDEIGMAWSIMRSHWQAYKKRLESLPKGDTGTSLTREKWIMPLLGELGYEMAIQRAQQIGGKSYAISHGASNKDFFPIHVMGYNDHLDKRRDNSGPRLSPHALVQEYLNNTEHMFALVTNGRHLRLLRDATRLVRMSYLEFDLERMFEEELYADFSILYRVIHSSRMPEKVDQGEDSIIEYYHQESLASGTRIREKLSEAVENSIKTLANGFLAHPKNDYLVTLFEAGHHSPERYYMHQLRLIYRILFLIVLEERKLVYPEQLTEAQQRLRDVYYKYYSIERLRKLTENRVYVDADKYDLWESLKTTFLLFEEEQYGSKLGIKPLGSGIFAPDALGPLKGVYLSNGVLLGVLKRLTTFVGEQGQLVRVNYSDLDVEEFGSVYEGLLEYDPVVEKIGALWEFSFVAGDKRSSSGSHYTPEELVKPLVKHSLDHVIEERLRRANGEERMANGEWQMANSETVLANLRSLQTYFHNLITNLIVENEIVSGFDHLGERHGDSHRSVSINQLLSQRRVIWDDFAAPKGIRFGASQYSRGMGTKQQQRVQSLFEDSQREPERSGNTLDAGGKGEFVPGGGDIRNHGKIQYTWKANSQLPTVTLSQKQIESIWQLLPSSTRHLLLANYHLLSITVCDVAGGSGHILLSAARRIATELASVREGAEQPSPAYYRAAMRDVVRHCIYGVDLNPLAVELTKVALWIEAHNPGEPLNFLDHHIKCGNSIVGLAHRDDLERGIATEAFKTLPGDDKEVAKSLRERNEKQRKEVESTDTVVQLNTRRVETSSNLVQEALVEYRTFNKLPETTPEEIQAKQKAYQRFIDGKGYSFLKAMADTQVAQFFIPKTKENVHRLMTDGEYRQILGGWQGWQDQKVANATVVAHQKRFFHWFLEFPEVFSKGGFDCILGNPPFLGGKKISGSYGDDFLNYIKNNFAPAIGGLDLVAYFFKRVFSILRPEGFQSLISTNTIAQGDTRIGGLVEIEKLGGVINHAVRSMKWPGLAAVEVALVTIYKGTWRNCFLLDQKDVSHITTYLDDSIHIGEPFALMSNQALSFQGSVILGQGFLLSPEKAENLLLDNPKNIEVIKPYLIGDDLNNQLDQSPTRWLINFYDWPLRRYSKEEWNLLNNEAKKEIEDKVLSNRFVSIVPPNYTDRVARDFEECIDIVEREVKPERLLLKDKGYREKWWQFGRRAVDLYSSIEAYDKVLIRTQAGKHNVFEFTQTNKVFDQKLIVFKIKTNKEYCELNSCFHEVWFWKYKSDLGETPNYSPTNIFSRYPLTRNSNEALNIVGELCLKKRHSLVNNLKIGLTKTYNTFHAREIQSNIKTNELENKSNKEIEQFYGKEVWNLWKHLLKTEGACSWEEAVKGIEELRQLHKQMDEAVLEAYGWHEDTQKWGKAINLRHDFYEVDYLPENDRLRYTIHPEARKEVLKRLLLLNHERYEEEILQGLHKKADVEKFYADKGKPMPKGLTFSDGKGAEATGKKAKPPKEEKPKALKPSLNPAAKQTGFAFDIPEEVAADLKVTLQKQDGTLVKYHICGKNSALAPGYQILAPDVPLAEIIRAKEEGGKFQFEGVWYMVVEKL